MVQVSDHDARPAASTDPDETGMAGMAGRYGATTPAQRRAGIGLLALVGAVALGFLLWAALHHANPAVRAAVTGFAIVDDERVDVVFEVRRDPGTEVTCTLRARGIDRSTVGTVQIPVAASAERTSAVRAAVPTRTRAVSGELVRCQAAEDVPAP